MKHFLNVKTLINKCYLFNNNHFKKTVISIPIATPQANALTVFGATVVYDYNMNQGKGFEQLGDQARLQGHLRTKMARTSGAISDLVCPKSFDGCQCFQPFTGSLIFWAHFRVCAQSLCPCARTCPTLMASMVTKNLAKTEQFSCLQVRS